VLSITPKNGLGNLSPISIGACLIVITFALAYLILQKATFKGIEGNSFYGLAIGFTATAMAYTLGDISGGAFNPAVAIGAFLVGLFT